jgi:signal peptidase I
MKVVFKIVSILLLAMMLLLGAIYLLPNFDLYTVRSDSMRPAIRAGDAIVTVPPGYLGTKLAAGSIVAFNKGSETITHRILSIDAQGNITVKGDANEEADPTPYTIFQVSGVYLFKIPYLGYVNAFLHTKTGWFAAIIVPAFLLVLWLAIEIVREAFRKEKTNI